MAGSHADCINHPKLNTYMTWKMIRIFYPKAPCKTHNRISSHKNRFNAQSAKSQVMIRFPSITQVTAWLRKASGGATGTNTNESLKPLEAGVNSLKNIWNPHVTSCYRMTPQILYHLGDGHLHHQEFQVPKMEVLNLIRLFWGGPTGESTSILGTWNLLWFQLVLWRIDVSWVSWVTRVMISCSTTFWTTPKPMFHFPVWGKASCIVSMYSKLDLI